MTPTFLPFALLGLCGSVACSDPQVATPGRSVGFGCTEPSQCATGLSCLDVAAKFVAASGGCTAAIASGKMLLCTTPCDLPSDCSPFAVGGVCSRFGCEKNDFCLGAAGGAIGMAGDTKP